MGLDWVLDRRKPKRGKRAEFDRLMKKLNAMADESPKRAALEARLDAVSDTVWDHVGAPQIGEDKRANAWFRKNVYEPRQKQLAVMDERQAAFWSRPFEELLAESRGKYVLDLAKDKKGFAGGSFLVGKLDFGAGVIDQCSDVLDGDLIAEAWTSHTAAEAKAYARKLEKALKSAPRKVDAPSGALGLADQRKAVAALVHWVGYWSGAGFGFQVWF